MKSLFNYFCALLLCLGLTAWADEGHETSPVGKPVTTEQANKTIQVKTLDTMRFTFDPPLEQIDDGEVIRFVVINTGTVPHEFFIGSEAEQQAHAAMMMEMPNMVHNDTSTLTVAPGETKEITWAFSGTGPVVFACNIPGHYQAGMFLVVPIK